MKLTWTNVNYPCERGCAARAGLCYFDVHDFGPSHRLQLHGYTPTCGTFAADFDTVDAAKAYAQTILDKYLKAACECGAAKCGSAIHSPWCPSFIQKT